MRDARDRDSFQSVDFAQRDARDMQERDRRHWGARDGWVGWDRDDRRDGPGMSEPRDLREGGRGGREHPRDGSGDRDRDRDGRDFWGPVIQDGMGRRGREREMVKDRDDRPVDAGVGVRDGRDGRERREEGAWEDGGKRRGTGLAEERDGRDRMRGSRERGAGWQGDDCEQVRQRDHDKDREVSRGGWGPSREQPSSASRGGALAGADSAVAGQERREERPQTAGGSEGAARDLGGGVGGVHGVTGSAQQAAASTPTPAAGGEAPLPRAAEASARAGGLRHDNDMHACGLAHVSGAALTPSVASAHGARGDGRGDLQWERERDRAGRAAPAEGVGWGSLSAASTGRARGGWGSLAGGGRGGFAAGRADLVISSPPERQGERGPGEQDEATPMGDGRDRHSWEMGESVALMEDRAMMRGGGSARGGETGGAGGGEVQPAPASAMERQEELQMPDGEDAMCIDSPSQGGAQEKRMDKWARGVGVAPEAPCDAGAAAVSAASEVRPSTGASAPLHTPQVLQRAALLGYDAAAAGWAGRVWGASDLQPAPAMQLPSGSGVPPGRAAVALQAGMQVHARNLPNGVAGGTAASHHHLVPPHPASSSHPISHPSSSWSPLMRRPEPPGPPPQQLPQSGHHTAMAAGASRAAHSMFPAPHMLANAYHRCVEGGLKAVLSEKG
jgi:hypothetical protein